MEECWSWLPSSALGGKGGGGGGWVAGSESFGKSVCVHKKNLGIFSTHSQVRLLEDSIVCFFSCLFISLERSDHDWVDQTKLCITVEPRFNEIAGDRPDLFVKWRVRYIENLDTTNLRGNDQNVRYIEVVVNDWFVTQVTSVEIL